MQNDPNTALSDKQIDDAITSRKKLSHPSILDQANVLSWMKKEGIKVVGSFLEADQQLRKLEMDKVVDAIATEDGDLVVLGAKKVLSKSSTRDGKLMFRIFDRDELYDMRSQDCHLSKLFLYNEACIDIALLLGNDYVQKMEGNGITTVLENTDWKRRRRNEDRVVNNGLIDSIARSGNPEMWFEEYVRSNADKIKSSSSDDLRERASTYSKRLISARRYMLHAPVFERNETTGEITLVPLNPLPDGIDIDQWKEYIGFDFEADSSVDESQFVDAYECNILPLSGKPPHDHRGPLFTAVENPKVSTDEVLPLFARLNFEEVPVMLQPKVCLRYWLKSRGWNERDADTRTTIERDVNLYRVVNRIVYLQDKDLSVGEYNAMEVLTYRDAHNEYDTWNKDYFTICQKIRRIDNNAVDPRVVAFIPNSEKRASLLVFGFHYNPQSIECVNVESKIDGSKCIMFRVECLGSKKTRLIHMVHAVFEDKQGGVFLLSPYSTCSCDDGALFCSHMLGFLYLLGLIQDEPSQAAFEKWYKADQELLLAKGALIEALTAMDKFNREVAQSNRQSKRN